MPARKFIKVNLLPKDAFELSFLGKFLKWSLTAGRVIVVLTEFVVILAFASRFWFDKKLNDLREANSSKQTTILSYAETENKMREILVKQKAVDNFLEEGFQVNDGLDKLRLLLPSGTVLSQVNFTPTGLGIAGISGSEQALAQTIGAMKSYHGVVGLEIKKIEFDQKKGGVEFEIIGRFEKKKK
jgi:hypothetical protein